MGDIQFHPLPKHSRVRRLLAIIIYYSAKKLKLRRVLQTLCGAFEQCSRVRLELRRK